MAGIAGIYCADGRPAEVADLKRMVAAIEHRGPDGIAYWNSGAVAFSHLQLHTTPESLHERQPLVSPGGEARLAWNGRLDNREELLGIFASRGTRPVDLTDPGLALSAYLLWGTDCLQRLVGDFAFALWDARHRQLWCARDYVGVRPFYYFWDGKTFLFGPEIRALLAHPLVSLKINEGMAGEYLANAITSRDETLYADIRRLPSGSHLTIDGPGSLRVDSWWEPELGLLHYRTDEEYAEHFRHLFDQSVRSRMRCNTPWGVQMSGGLDSSSIAVSARAVLGKSGMDDGRILTFSMACPGKPWDESEDIAAVVQKASLTSEFFLPLNADLEFFRQRAAFWRDYPGNPNGEPMFLPIANAARRHEARVLFVGTGGDEWLDGNAAYLSGLAASLVRPGQARQMLERSKDEWRTGGSHGFWPLFLARRLLVASAPGWAHRRRRALRLERHGFLSREFLCRTDLVERIAGAPERETRRFASRAQRAIFRLVTGGFEGQVLEWNDRDAAGAGAEFRFPFFDRRLAEFCLRLPEDQRQRGAVWKRLLRNAMDTRLPDRVRQKTYKAEFSELFEKVILAPQARARLDNPVIGRHTDWLDPHRFALHMGSLIDSRRVWPVWVFLGVDLWFENVLSGDPSDGRPRHPIFNAEARTTNV